MQLRHLRNAKSKQPLRGTTLLASKGAATVQLYAEAALTQIGQVHPDLRSPEDTAQPQMLRLVDRDRPLLSFTLDGAPATAHEGDTILTAVLTARPRLAEASSVDGPRAGFCLMGACQECWVAVVGVAVRACGTLLAAGMRVMTDRHAARG